MIQYEWKNVTLSGCQKSGQITGHQRDGWELFTIDNGIAYFRREKIENKQKEHNVIGCITTIIPNDGKIRLCMYCNTNHRTADCIHHLHNNSCKLIYGELYTIKDEELKQEPHIRRIKLHHSSRL